MKRTFSPALASIRGKGAVCSCALASEKRPSAPLPSSPSEEERKTTSERSMVGGGNLPGGSFHRGAVL
jgi:hypothetical protein